MSLRGIHELGAGRPDPPPPNRWRDGPGGTALVALAASILLAGGFGLVIYQARGPERAQADAGRPRPTRIGRISVHTVTHDGRDYVVAVRSASPDAGIAITPAACPCPEPAP